ncbi:MAG: hypothetical protein HZY76_15895 [Anaerolineae bacterium]|nr:MAG: hypothetical protein HZY76_15895 [Anaerolineae bacterium]
MQELLAAPDPVAALEANWDRVNSAFIDVLALNLAAADQQGATATAAKLEQLMAAIDRAARASHPRFSSSMICYGPITRQERRLLGERRQEITPDVLDIMESLAQTLDGQGQPEMSKRLRDIRGQAMLLA